METTQMNTPRKEEVTIKFGKGLEEPGPTILKLRETLTGIQMGELEAPEGWIHEIKC